MTPLFYSQSTDLPVLRGRRCGDGALERPQTGDLYNKFVFQALRLRDGPANRPGANTVPRVRTVVRGERASGSIVNRTTALWSIWMVASLILAYLALRLIFT